MTSKEFLLTVQSMASTFKALPVQNYLPDVILDIKNSPGIEEEQIALENGVVILTHLSGRSTWIKDLTKVGGDLQVEFLKPLYLSKIKTLEELVSKRGNHKHTLVVRAPGPDLFIEKIKHDDKWKIGQIVTVVIALQTLPVRITIAQAHYERMSGHMLSTNILAGVL